MPFTYPLNHCLISVDPKQFKAITTCNFISDFFAPASMRTSANDLGKYTGFYIYGERAYLEIFEFGNNPYAKPHHIGLGFGTDDIGGLQVLKKRCDEMELNITPRIELIHQGTGDQKRPWFYMGKLDFEKLGDGLMSWLMEYHPDYLRPLGGDGKTIDRKTYLAKSRKLNLHTKEEPLFHDIKEIHIRLTETFESRLHQQLLAQGYEVQKTPSGWMARGSENTFHVERASRCSFMKLTFSLTREVPKSREFSFGGNCVLTVGPGAAANWIWA